MLRDFRAIYNNCVKIKEKRRKGGVKVGEFKKKALTRRRYFGILPKSAKRHGPLAQLVRATGS